MDPRLHLQVQDWLITVGFFGSLCWGVYLITAFVRRKQQNAMQRHVLDKFSSAQDFAQFVQSPAGQKYLDGFGEAVSSPRNQILTSVKTGCVVMFSGIGFLVGNAGMGSFSFRIGWILFLVGIGFLVAAAISYFLAKKVGWKEQA